jgi:hypothetical protein
MLIIRSSIVCVFLASGAYAQESKIEFHALDSDTSGVEMYGRISSEGFLEVVASKQTRKEQLNCSGSVDAKTRKDETAQINFDQDFRSDNLTDVIYRNEDLTLKTIQGGVFSCLRR